MLNGKNIILGVTSSIAAYKSAFLVRLLVKAGANVQVVMTPSAREFITPLTLSVLSKRPVLWEFSTAGSGQWNNHVELGLWADLMLIAPASANTLAKMANGICDNLLLGTYLSARCPVYLAPAMDLDMYKHASTTDNLIRLKSRGHRILIPGYGELASGLIGEGRMAEPEEIIASLEKILKEQAPLFGRKALVTAGPTFEAIDPVRFIGNHSSGRMGFALADELAMNGAEVTLVCGPNALHSGQGHIKRLDVVSAEEMYTACMNDFKTADITVMAAAVADYKPVHKATGKIKKEGGQGLSNIELEQTRDILTELGSRKTAHQILVGFALETDSEVEHAKAKLVKKNLDFVVLNSLRDTGAGFGTTSNKITIIDKHNKTENFELKDKKEVARDIVNKIKSLLPDSNTGSVPV
ncbi:MAG: bifunctional phosphopantothenoylcysteine decarboxylase/phosphopantothenate--cysteine ligase CoaBC [Bacteroidia bacterium]